MDRVFPDAEARQALAARIRVAVRHRTESSSLRRTAREIGLSPTGLQHFLNGREPYRHTFAKLTAWYRRCPHALTAPEAADALEVLVSELPCPELRREAVRGMLHALGLCYPSEPPAWMRDLLRHAGAHPPAGTPTFFPFEPIERRLLRDPAEHAPS